MDVLIKIKKMPVKSGYYTKVNNTRMLGRFSIINFLVFLGLILLVCFFIFNIGKSIYTSIFLFSANKKLEANIDQFYYEKLILLDRETEGISDTLIKKEAKNKLGLLRSGEELLVFRE